MAGHDVRHGECEGTLRRFFGSCVLSETRGLVTREVSEATVISRSHNAHTTPDISFSWGGGENLIVNSPFSVGLS